MPTQNSSFILRHHAICICEGCRHNHNWFGSRRRKSEDAHLVATVRALHSCYLPRAGGPIVLLISSSSVPHKVCQILDRDISVRRKRPTSFDRSSLGRTNFWALSAKPPIHHSRTSRNEIEYRPGERQGCLNGLWHRNFSHKFQMQFTAIKDTSGSTLCLTEVPQVVGKQSYVLLSAFVIERAIKDHVVLIFYGVHATLITDSVSSLCFWLGSALNF